MEENFPADSPAGGSEALPPEAQEQLSPENSQTLSMYLKLLERAGNEARESALKRHNQKAAALLAKIEQAGQEFLKEEQEIRKKEQNGTTVLDQAVQAEHFAPDARLNTLLGCIDDPPDESLARQFLDSMQSAGTI